MKYLTPKQVNKIIDTICDEYCITLEELKSESRVHEISEPRAIIFYIVCTLNKYSIRALARLMNRGHANIHTMSRRVATEMEVDEDYKEKVDRLVKIVEKQLKD